MINTKVLYGFLLGFDEIKKLFPKNIYHQLYDIFSDISLVFYFDKILANIIKNTDNNEIIFQRIDNYYQSKYYFNDNNHIKMDEDKVFIGIVISEAKTKFHSILNIMKISEKQENIIHEFINKNTSFKNLSPQLYTFTNYI